MRAAGRQRFHPVNFRWCSNIFLLLASGHNPQNGPFVEPAKEVLKYLAIGFIWIQKGQNDWSSRAAPTEIGLCQVL